MNQITYKIDVETINKRTNDYNLVKNLYELYEENEALAKSRFDELVEICKSRYENDADEDKKQHHLVVNLKHYITKYDYWDIVEEVKIY